MGRPGEPMFPEHRTTDTKKCLIFKDNWTNICKYVKKNGHIFSCWWGSLSTKAGLLWKWTKHLHWQHVKTHVLDVQTAILFNVFLSKIMEKETPRSSFSFLFFCFVSFCFLFFFLNPDPTILTCKWCFFMQSWKKSSLKSWFKQKPKGYALEQSYKMTKTLPISAKWFIGFQPKTIFYWHFPQSWNLSFKL